MGIRPEDVSFDVNEEKERLEMEKAFENFDEHSVVKPTKRNSLDRPSAKHTSAKGRKTIGIRPEDVSFDVNEEKERVEIEKAFENFDEHSVVKPTKRNSLDRPNLKKTFARSRKTMGIHVEPQSFDIKEEKERIEMEKAFENFEENPSVIRTRGRSRGEPNSEGNLKQTSTKVRKTMGIQPEVFSFDIKEEKERVEMEIAFENFDENYTLKPTKRNSLDMPSSKDISSKSRKTMGIEPEVISFDISEEKERVVMEKAFVATLGMMQNSGNENVRLDHSAKIKRSSTESYESTYSFLENENEANKRELEESDIVSITEEKIDRDSELPPQKQNNRRTRVRKTNVNNSIVVESPPKVDGGRLRRKTAQQNPIEDTQDTLEANTIQEEIIENNNSLTLTRGRRGRACKAFASATEPLIEINSTRASKRKAAIKAVVQNAAEEQSNADDQQPISPAVQNTKSVRGRKKKVEFKLDAEMCAVNVAIDSSNIQDLDKVESTVEQVISDIKDSPKIPATRRGRRRKVELKEIQEKTTPDKKEQLIDAHDDAAKIPVVKVEPISGPNIEEASKGNTALNSRSRRRKIVDDVKLEKETLNISGNEIVPETILGSNESLKIKTEEFEVDPSPVTTNKAPSRRTRKRKDEVIVNNKQSTDLNVVQECNMRNESEKLEQLETTPEKNAATTRNGKTNELISTELENKENSKAATRKGIKSTQKSEAGQSVEPVNIEDESLDSKGEDHKETFATTSQENDEKLHSLEIQKKSEHNFRSGRTRKVKEKVLDKVQNEKEPTEAKNEENSEAEVASNSYSVKIRTRTRNQAKSETSLNSSQLKEGEFKEDSIKGSPEPPVITKVTRRRGKRNAIKTPDPSETYLKENEQINHNLSSVDISDEDTSKKRRTTRSNKTDIKIILPTEKHDKVEQLPEPARPSTRRKNPIAEMSADELTPIKSAVTPIISTATPISNPANAVEFKTPIQTVPRARRILRSNSTHTSTPNVNEVQNSSKRNLSSSEINKSLEKKDNSENEVLPSVRRTRRRLNSTAEEVQTLVSDEETLNDDAPKTRGGRIRRKRDAVNEAEIEDSSSKKKQTRRTAKTNKKDHLSNDQSDNEKDKSIPPAGSESSLSENKENQALEPNGLAPVKPRTTRAKRKVEDANLSADVEEVIIKRSTRSRKK